MVTRSHSVSVLCFYLSMMKWNHGDSPSSIFTIKFNKIPNYYNSIKYEARRKSCKNTSYRTRQPTYSASTPTKKKENAADLAGQVHAAEDQMRRPLQGVRTKRGGGSLCRRRRKPLQAAAAVFRVGSGRSNDFARAGDRVSEGICVFYPFSKLFFYVSINVRRLKKAQTSFSV
jgi:hypothetical protein